MFEYFIGGIFGFVIGCMFNEIYGQKSRPKKKRTTQKKDEWSKGWFSGFTGLVCGLTTYFFTSSMTTSYLVLVLTYWLFMIWIELHNMNKKKRR